ncbi:MAG: proA [Bacteroidetes bacterium]|nr:proA [Bacteroidota bacterium]
MELLNSLFESARKAGASSKLLESELINKVLLEVADAAERHASVILIENQKDLDRMDPENPKYDRLKLTAERINGIASDMRNVATLPFPQGRLLDSYVRPNGMRISKITVPFGVIGIIYEARPNVTFDVFSLCFKSGNGCVLKGGSDAHYSNIAILKVIHGILLDNGIDPNVCTLLPDDREATNALLHAREYVDMVIPRGSKALIDFVRENARIPVIETGAGVCHTYFDKSGDIAKGAPIIYNSKTRRVSVCNSLDCMIIHSERLGDLPVLTEKLKASNVLIYADERALKALSGKYPEELLKQASDESFGTEFLDYIMAIKTVDSLEEALVHIEHFGSKHSECIVSEDKEAIELFKKTVDAACVYANVSTAFTDGGEFGFGAEIGISTQKLHARGPMALAELCSYKWIIEGEGQIR